jgi:orotate phosphoribosyltransferase
LSGDRVGPPAYSGQVHEALADHLRRHALRTGEFTLRSGARSRWYVDARSTTFSGEGARLVAEAVLSVLDPGVSALGGPAQGADPIAVATAVVAAGRGRALKAFSVRSAAKEHGLGGRLVGPLGPEDRVAVVEDTTTTGTSLLEAVDALAAEGIGVVQAVILVDRSDGRAAGAFAERGIPYRALLLPADLGVGP